MGSGGLSTLADIYGPLGALVLAVTGLAAFAKGWVVPGTVYRDMKRDRDDWREAATMSGNAAETALRVTAVNRRVSARQRRQREEADEG